jgi:hypothetical protein
MVPYRVLPRTNLAYFWRRSTPNSRPLNLLPPLCSLFATPVLCFQQLAASFAKTPGWGVPLQKRSLESITYRLFSATLFANWLPHVRFARPLFSWCYELLFPQHLYFHNHPRCPGGVGYAVPLFTSAPRPSASTYRNVTGSSHLLDKWVCGLRESGGRRVRGAG